jgi:hypothetical protein
MVAPITVPGILRAGTHAARPAANTVAAGTVYACSTHGLGYQSDGATWNNWLTPSGTAMGLSFIIDGAGSVITTGDKGWIRVPFACTIVGATLLADTTGSIVVDVQRATYAAYPTFTSLTASAPPTISSAQKAQDTTLTGWTTAIASGDLLKFVVTGSPAAITKVTIALDVTKS